MANVNVTPSRISPVGGTSSDGGKQGIIPSTAKVAQNDTITVQDGVEILDAELKIASTGVSEPYTISGNVITLTSATAGPVRGTVIYR